MSRPLSGSRSWCATRPGWPTLISPSDISGHSPCRATSTIMRRDGAGTSRGVPKPATFSGTTAITADGSEAPAGRSRKTTVGATGIAGRAAGTDRAAGTAGRATGTRHGTAMTGDTAEGNFLPPTGTPVPQRQTARGQGPCPRAGPRVQGGQANDGPSGRLRRARVLVPPPAAPVRRRAAACARSPAECRGAPERRGSRR